MLKNFSSRLLAMLALISIALPCLAQSNYSQSFDGVTAPALPTGWSSVGLGGTPSTPARTQAGTSVSTPNYLNLTAGGAGITTFAIYSGQTFTGGNIKYAFNNANGATNRGWVVFDYQDASNYYYAVPTTTSITIFKMVAGTPTSVSTISSAGTGSGTGYIFCEIQVTVTAGVNSFQGRLYNNGSAAGSLVSGSGTDTTYTSGLVGIRQPAANTAANVDDFSFDYSVSLSGGAAATNGTVTSTSVPIHFSTVPSGGTTPYSYQLKRSINGGTSYVNINSAVTGQTGDYAATDSSPPAGTSGVLYKFTVTDSAGTPATADSSTVSVNVPAATNPATTFAFSPSSGTGSTGANGTSFSVGPVDGSAAAAYLRGGNMTISLASSGSGGVFKAADGVTTITSLTFTASGTNAVAAQTFFYQNATAGSYALTLTTTYTDTGFAAPGSNTISYTVTTSPLALSTPSVSQAASGITITATASGGGGTYTHYVHALALATDTPSGTSAGSGTCIAVQTGASLNQTASLPVRGKTMWIMDKVVDNASNTVSSTPLYAVQPVVGNQIGFIGDSITAGLNTTGVYPTIVAMDVLAQQQTAGIGGINSSGGVFGINTFVDIQRGASGTLLSSSAASGGTGNWQPAGSIYLNAISAFGNSTTTPWVCICIGRNDVNYLTNTNYAARLSDYQTMLTNVVTDLVGRGYKVILNVPISFAATATTGVLTVPQAQALMREYGTVAIPNVVSAFASSNPGMVFLGDTQAYSFFTANPSLWGDGVHPTPAGYRYLGYMWANAIRKVIYADAGSGSIFLRRGIQ